MANVKSFTVIPVMHDTARRLVVGRSYMKHFAALAFSLDSTPCTQREITYMMTMTDLLFGFAPVQTSRDMDDVVDATRLPSLSV